jgi:hypothetical protein
MVCKGICVRHRALKPGSGKRYLIGQKRCNECEIFIEWQGSNCPCCSYRLRTKPRNRKLKLILLDKIKTS